VLNISELAINKRCGKLKYGVSKCPTFSYCHR
jgi:hypothetical protein